MKLTRTERWILSNQFMILEALYPDEADFFQKCREVVDCGYELNYDWIVEYIYPDDQTVTVEECKEVLDILDMFSFLKRAYEALTDKSEVNEAWVKFAGFDGNTETSQLAYTRFLVEREERFTDIGRGSFDDFNSHMPVLARYRQMLAEWERSADKYNLTKADLVRITATKQS